MKKTKIITPIFKNNSKPFIVFIISAVLLTVVLLTVPVHCSGFVYGAGPQALPAEFKSGWYQREPYQHETSTGEITAVTGLDIQIARELFDEAGYRISFEATSWSDVVHGLKTGEIDFVMGSYYEKNREEFVHYSIPYRTEQSAIYYHKSISELDGTGSESELTEKLEKIPLNMAVIDEYAYGSEDFKVFLSNPPPALNLLPSAGYEDSLHLMMQRQVDIFVSNPVIMDRLLAEKGYTDRVKKLRIDMKDIPVHIMFSKQTISPEQLEEFNAIVAGMRDSGRIRSLHMDFVLPAYLSIATGQFWFVLLNLLGITAFCTSGVLLARKERYNLFGALVLAILPAIGGGVLRDILLGADRIFILKTPAYLLVAMGVVVFSFLGFKIYDFLYGNSREITRKFDQYTEGNVGRLFGQLFKFFDAWAVASFTVIGVSVAVEMKSDPLWLWGPAMGVVTAAGGVVLRDMVRADFNIEMLKQDSYAEISILGGIIYTAALMFIPYNITLDLIFYLTVTVIVFLFGLRFFVLWKGYANPFQFGALHTHPETGLRQFMQQEPQLWKLLTGYYKEDSQGKALPVTLTEAEELHNRFLYTAANLKETLDKVAAEPLSHKAVKKFLECSSRLNIITSAEETLCTFIEHPSGSAQSASLQAAELQQRIHEGLKTLIETAASAADSGDLQDFIILEGITSKQQERFNQLRARYSAAGQQDDDAYLAAVIQATHKVERIIYLLGDYVRLILHKKDLRSGNASNRKARQTHLLNK